MHRRSMSVLGALIIVVATGCARRAVAPVTLAPSDSPSPSASASPGGDGGTTWFIVLRVADDPAGVREDTATLGPLLGGAIQVAPGSCFTGLPGRFGGDRYVLGAVGNSKPAVDELAARTHIDPLFEGRVQVVCTD